MPKTHLVYHYTSLSTLISIVQANSIRMCNIRFMNDGNEFIYGKEMFTRILTERLKSEQEVEKVTCCFGNRLVPHVSTFAFCMSSLRDAFTQWRLYGDDGRGVAIGFEQSALQSMEDCSLVPVVYDLALQTEKLSEAAEMVASDTNCLINTTLGVQGKIEPLLASIKQVEFSAEAELRLVTRATDIDEFDDDGHGYSTFNASFESIEYFARGGLLIPFVVKPLPSNAIREVIVGPLVNSNGNTASIESWIRKNGFASTTVVASKIAYQN